jgi:molecular chaperone DnaK
MLSSHWPLKEKRPMGKVVGIDLGTTNSVVAVMEGKEVKVIPNSHGSNLTPSVVAITDRGERLVGVTAKNQAIMNPKNTIYEIKRFMGRRASEVQNEIKRVPYEVVGSGDEPVRVRAGGKLYTPQEISAMVLQDLKQSAENYLGTKITDAVITCPAYFNDAQRQATKEAGQIAGFNVRRIFNEPTASSLAYGLDKKVAHKIAVYDLGGGTFDISILEVDKEVIQVLSTNGDTHLGGSDFDQRIVNFVAEEFRKEHGIDLRQDPMALQRLKDAAERAKMELSTMVETEINLPFITQVRGQPKNLSMRLTRAKLEQLLDDLLTRSMEPVRQALSDARLRPSDVQECVMVGGQTRMPKVLQLVREFFGREPHRGVNPDEVVAIGAAIQAAILGGEMKDILLLDVTPLTLGVETQHGVRDPVIKRNSAIPTKQSKVYSTAADGQTLVEVHVVQGEREMAADNRSLGRFRLEGIPPAPRGVPQIEVTFEIDANGILSVSAKDRATGKQQQITITASTGLSKEEVQRMEQEAEQFKDEDRKRRELADAKNHAENLVYQAEKVMGDLGSKLSSSERESVQKNVERIKSAMAAGQAEEIKRSAEELQKSLYELGRKAYEGARQPGAEPPPKQEGGKKDGEDKVIDAEFETKN